MEIKIKITEQEILDKPNDAELGSYIRKKYMVLQESLKQEVDILSLGQIPDDEPERCLICGKFSPYVKSTHIDMRVGFVEGVGQSCFMTTNCEKYK
jgi:hypothetical protein